MAQSHRPRFATFGENTHIILGPLDNVPHNGGKVDDESDSGCLEWWVYGMNPQF